MNHLAHADLARIAGVSIAGSFAGDFVRGRLDDAAVLELYSSDLIEGIRFHRAVDAFTDGHPVVARAVARFSPPHRRWAGVLVDVWFDHLLARAWTERHPESLENFAARVAAELRARRDELPARAHPFLDFILRENLLVTYRDEHGASRAFGGMSRRVARAGPLATAMDAIRPHADALVKDFDVFFPEAVTMAKNWRGDASGAASAGDGGRS